MGEDALTVIRTEKLEEAIEVLKEHELELLKASELYNI